MNEEEFYKNLINEARQFLELQDLFQNIQVEEFLKHFERILKKIKEEDFSH